VPALVCAMDPACREGAWEASKIISAAGSSSAAGVMIAWKIGQILKAEQTHPEDTGAEAGRRADAPEMDYPGDDPAKAPSEEWEWRGSGPPESGQGAWYNPGTTESLHPDLKHAPPKGPHWDYIDPDGGEWDGYPDGRWVPKP